MSGCKINMMFHSPLGELMSRFILEKQACGYSYERAIQRLHHLDRFLCDFDLQTPQLPKKVVERWIAKQAHEQPGNQRQRIIILRQFALFARRQGFEAHVPDTKESSVINLDFTPYLFRREEVKRILQAADRLPSDNRTPRRHLIMPEVFRLLYCCGMRVGEVLKLRVADVDINAGVLTIRNAKFNKDRLIPLPKSMVARLERYTAVMGAREADAIFFPAPDRGSYSTITVYAIFRRLLRECGIPHEGRGKGPRLHDLRHAFAVHNLERWYRQGEDLEIKLPLLAAFMGHKSLVGTQRYLRLTPEIFPDIRDRLENFVGHAIPRRSTT